MDVAALVCINTGLIILLLGWFTWLINSNITERCDRIENLLTEKKRVGAMALHIDTLKEEEVRRDASR